MGEEGCVKKISPYFLIPALCLHEKAAYRGIMQVFEFWLPVMSSIGPSSGPQSIIYSGYYRFDPVTIDLLCRPLRAFEPGDEP